MLCDVVCVPLVILYKGLVDGCMLIARKNAAQGTIAAQGGSTLVRPSTSHAVTGIGR